MRWGVAATAVVFIVALALGLFAVRQVRRNSTSRTFVLSNGSVLVFRGVTYGTNHVAPGSDNRFMDLLPAPVRRLFHRTGQASVSATTPTGMFWFERLGAGVPMGNDWNCTVVMTDGFEATGSGARFSSGSSSNVIEGHACAITRRERLLRVRVYEENWSMGPRSTLLGEFTVPNPAPIESTRWTAEPLPETRHDDAIEATLLKLASRPRSTNSTDQAQTVAQFAIREHGIESTNWRVLKIEATDATGNVIVPQSWGGPYGKLATFEYSPPLWPSEVYKLRVEFGRANWAPFAPQELWVITNVAVPTNGGFTSVEAKTNLNGFNVCFHGVSTVPGNAPWKATFSSAGGQSLDFDITPWPQDHRFTLVRVQDDQGRTVEEAGSSYGGTNYSIGLRPKPGMKTLNLTIAMPKSRFLDFVAQPVLTNKWR